LARAENKREVFVVGGEAIYAATLPHADMIYITEVDTVIEGDAFFPQFDESKFDEVTSRSVAADEHNEHAFQLRVLKRKN
jgi:dihydrofolate reductase